MDELKETANKVVGTKQVVRGLKAGTIAKVYVANDADTYIYMQVVRAAEDAHVPCTRVESMKELGKACGLRIAAACAGITR